MALCVKGDERHFECRTLCYIEEGKSAVVKKLLESSGKFCDLVDSSGSTLLHYAAKFSNAKVLEYLIRSGSDVDAKDNVGRTPLMLAVRTGQRKTIVKLLEAKARIDVKNNLCEDALCMIARLWTRPDRKLDNRVTIVKRFLLQLKLECSNDSQTMANRLLEAKCPLYFGVYLKNATVTDVMLANRVIDPRELVTAAHVAVGIADLDNVKLLVDNGAVDACGEEHPLLCYDSPKDNPQKLEILNILLARTSFYGEKLRMKICLMLEECSRDAARVLLQHVDLLTEVTFENLKSTYLHWLMVNANEGIVNELPANANLDFDKTDSMGISCLVYAVCVCNLSTVEFLLRKGVQVNGVDRMGFSVLFNAIHTHPTSRSWKIMNVLLKYGADVRCTYKSDTTLFDYAHPQNIVLLKPVIAQLAKLESLGKPISQLIYDKIESRGMFRGHFKLCKSRLERMKRITVHKSVTLYKLLTEPDEKVMSYVQNPEFPDRFNRLMRGRRRSNAYYDFLLRRRTFECIQVAQLKRDAAVAVSEILQVDNHTVTDKILDYLSADDWKSLRGVH